MTGPSVDLWYDSKHGVAMQCPACEETVAADDWICPHCDHILDSSFLGERDIHEEKTGVVAWARRKRLSDPSDAVILGDVNVAEDEFSVITGPGAGGDGRTSSFVYYAGESSARAVHPDAVPVIIHRDGTTPRTPFEDAMMLCIDGKRSVRELQKVSGLTPQDVVVSLLTLIDKGAIRIPDAPAAPGGTRRRRSRTGHRSQPLGMSPPHTSLVTHERPTAIVGSEAVAGSRAVVGSEGRTQALDLEVTESPNEPVPAPFRELPNISDFGEASSSLSSVGAQALPRGFSDVWADDDSSSAINAVNLIESEAPIGEDSRPVSNDFPAEVNAALDVAEGRAPAAVSVSAPSIAIPEISRPAGESLVERLASRARLEPEPLAGGESPISVPVDLDFDNEDDLPPVVPHHDLGAPDDVAQTKEIPIPLGPQFLEEVKSERARRPKNVARAPVKERVRPAPADQISVVPVTPAEAPPTPAPAAPSLAAMNGSAEPVGAPEASVAPEVSVASAAKRLPQPRTRKPARDGPKAAETSERRRGAREANAAKEEPRPTRTPREGLDPVDVVRINKAENLYEQALKDKAEGNLVSARMNMKLALTFDPSNEVYNRAYEELSRDPKAKPRSISSLRTEAKQLFEKASEAERHGDIDRAIELLEEAITKSRRAPYLNRLGVILAMKKNQHARAQSLIEQAIEMNPSNAAYARNLLKVRARASAAANGNTLSPSKKATGLLRGILGRKK